jgi:hypothetical protein
MRWAWRRCVLCHVLALKSFDAGALSASVSALGTGVQIRPWVGVRGIRSIASSLRSGLRTRTDVTLYTSWSGQPITATSRPSGTAAAVVLAEIALDIDPVPRVGPPGVLGGYAPGVKESAGKKKGNAAAGTETATWPRILGEAAVGAARSDTFLGARYRRIAHRRGKKRALVAVGRSILVIIWHLLSNPDTRFHDLGADFYETRHHPLRIQ